MLKKFPDFLNISRSRERHYYFRTFPPNNRLCETDFLWDFLQKQLELKYSLRLVKKEAFRKDFSQNIKDCPGSFAEAIVRWFSVKEMHLRISQNEQEILWTGVSFQQSYGTPQGDCLVFHLLKKVFHYTFLSVASTLMKQY